MNLEPINYNTIDELIDSIPLYEHIMPLTKERLYALWKQAITQIVRDQVDSKVKEVCEKYEKLFKDYKQEAHLSEKFKQDTLTLIKLEQGLELITEYKKTLEHIQKAEQDIYMDWQDIKNRVNALEKKKKN
jgi:gas vesicle protein